MATDLSGLFGGALTPEEMQQQQTEARALQFAKLAPSQQLAFMGYTAGGQLGQGLAKAAGVDIQDPAIKRATMLRQLAQGVDVTTVEGLKQYAQKLQQAGFTAEANQLGGQIQSMLESQTKQAQQAAAATASYASAGKAGAETQEIADKRAAKNARVQMLIDAGLSEKEAQGIASNDVAFSKLVENKRISTPADYAVQAQALGFGSKPYLSDYTPDQVKAMEKGVFAHKAGIAQAGAMAIKPVDVAAIIKEIGTKEDIKGKQESWAKAGTAYTAQIPMIRKLDEVVKNLPQTFTGSLSDIQLQFGKGLSSLGVPVDETKLANTEYMNSVSAQVLQTIARTLPGSLAVKEMEQLIKSKANSQQQIKTITKIIRDFKAELQAGTLSYEQLSKLPETERFNKDINYLTGTNYKKIQRYNDLTDQAQQAINTKKPMSKAAYEEAQQLRKELELGE